MISAETIDSYSDEQERDEIKKAIAYLTGVGLWYRERQLRKGIMLEGNSEQPPDELMHDILEYRRVAQELESMDLLGARYHEELSDA